MVLTSMISAFLKHSTADPLFLVQLCNSLVSDGTISYSPTKCRYDWNLADLQKLQTWDSVANFIVSNLNDLSPKSLQALRILSCLGMQTQKATLEYLILCPFIEGTIDIESTIPGLVDAGILESSSSMVKFTHDIIRQEVYTGIGDANRMQIHHCIGMFLGSNASCFGIEITGDCCKEDRKDLALMATDHINEASELVIDLAQRTRFAGWNLHMANHQVQNSNFQAALKYFQSGLVFLGNQNWSQMRYDLCKGAAFSSLATSKFEVVPKYVDAIIEKVPFEDSIEARALLIRSLEGTGTNNQETMATALAVLRKLGFDIPSLPQLYLSYLFGRARGLVPSIIKEGMKKTDEAASKCNFDCIADMNSSSIEVLKIFDSIILAGLRCRSPYFPLIVCATVRYSLENGVSEESALSFCLFGCFKLSIEDNYEKACYWGKMTLQLLERFRSKIPIIRTRLILCGYLLSFSRPLSSSRNDMLKLWELGMKVGDVQSASFALVMHLRYSMISGERLSSLREKYQYYLPQLVKYNREAAKLAILDKVNIDALLGVETESFSIFDGMIENENALLADAISKNNVALIHAIYLRRFFEHFWNGRYDAAMECSKLAFARLRFGFPSPVHVLHSAMKGLISFQKYQQGEGDAFFQLGKEMLSEVEKWHSRSENFPFKHYTILLQAEMYAANCEVVKAKDSFEAAIKMASNVNDQAAAYELQGNYLCSIIEIPQSIISYKNAYSCYMKWGCVHLAEKVKRERNLDVNQLELEANTLKHRRDVMSKEKELQVKNKRQVMVE